MTCYSQVFEACSRKQSRRNIANIVVGKVPANAGSISFKDAHNICNLCFSAYKKAQKFILVLTRKLSLSDLKTRPCWNWKFSSRIDLMFQYRCLDYTLNAWATHHFQSWTCRLRKPALDSIWEIMIHLEKAANVWWVPWVSPALFSSRNLCWTLEECADCSYSHGSWCLMHPNTNYSISVHSCPRTESWPSTSCLAHASHLYPKGRKK